jgi:hypothetical protein
LDGSVSGGAMMVYSSLLGLMGIALLNPSYAADEYDSQSMGIEAVTNIER